MADTVTANYSLTKPEDGASNNTWGAKINANLDAIDGQLFLCAPLISPAFTGTPTAPTPAPGDNDTSIATTAFVVAGFAPKASPSFTGTANFAGTVNANGGNFALVSNNTAYIWTDSGGSHPELICQSDNNMVFYGTNPDGSARTIFSVLMRDSAGTFMFSIPIAGPTPAGGDNSTKFATTAFVVTALGQFLPLAGGTVTGNIGRSGAGPHLYHVTAAFGSGRVFVTAAGASDPTSAAGDLWFELT